jgi:hypothetical protein
MHSCLVWALALIGSPAWKPRPSGRGGSASRLVLQLGLQRRGDNQASTPVLDKQYGVASARRRGLRKTAHANDFAVGSHRAMPGGSLWRTIASKRPRDAGRGFVRRLEAPSFRKGMHYLEHGHHGRPAKAARSRREARRARLGRFRAIEDLLEVKGVGRAMLKRIRPRVRLDPAPAPADAGAVPRAATASAA